MVIVALSARRVGSSRVMAGRALINAHVDEFVSQILADGGCERAGVGVIRGIVSNDLVQLLKAMGAGGL
jgi:hypothetical protein